ncbi:protein BOLA4, chloroplastic/mitochondrial [Ziziphus jujuba]|uniref:Protein BOLA4, chloroplastic/mitochondrial n=1 Tax=Ziziphus jujuba TaxID=326968 RepID=A0A6P3YZU9_ZIZJJ|nr:protein BOLA4, chloroplastic/mitochondrial [Ziziphus jujuba]
MSLMMRPIVREAVSLFIQPTAKKSLASQSLTLLNLRIQKHDFGKLPSSELHGRGWLSTTTTTTTNTSTSRATNADDAGAIDSPLMNSMQNKIKKHLNAETVTVKDAYGDGRHVSIDVVSAAFEGQSAVNRQRMVYKAIWEELQSRVHAVDQMTTKTPNEAAAEK